MNFSPLLCLALVVGGGCAVSSVVTPTGSVGPAVMLEQPEGGLSPYLGSGACRTCHAAVYERWRTTAHARDYAGLLSADRRVSACLRCHVTGYGDRLGYLAPGGDRDLANVGCEACHGPGADHGRSAHPELVPTLTGGQCPPCEINRVCRLCHTPDRSPGFELERALTRIGCKS